MTLPPARWLAPKEAAAYLSVTEDCLQAWRSARKGPAWSKRGKIVRYDVNDLDAFLANGRQESVKTAAAA